MSLGSATYAPLRPWPQAFRGRSEYGTSPCTEDGDTAPLAGCSPGLAASTPASPAAASAHSSAPLGRLGCAPPARLRAACGRAGAQPGRRVGRDHGVVSASTQPPPACAQAACCLRPYDGGARWRCATNSKKMAAPAARGAAGAAVLVRARGTDARAAAATTRSARLHGCSRRRQRCENQARGLRNTLRRASCGLRSRRERSRAVDSAAPAALPAGSRRRRVNHLPRPLLAATRVRCACRRWRGEQRGGNERVGAQLVARR